MRQVGTGIVGCLALVLALFGTVGTVGAVTSGAACPAPNVLPNIFRTITPADVALVEVGFICPLLDLEITQDLAIPAGLTTLTINVNTLKILNAKVINSAANSQIQLFSSGDITFTGANVRAKKNLKIACSSPGCKFTSTLSDIIAATDLVNPDSGGVITFDIDGPIDIRTTNLHGGDSIEMESKSSSITLLCGQGTTPCKDPLVPPIPPVIAAACPPVAGDPPGTLVHFPCNVTFLDAASLTSVCIGEVGVQCNGGNKEKRFTAFTFINVENSSIVSDEHVTFTCKTQDFKGHGVTLRAEQVAIRCQGKVDISDSSMVLDKGLSITVSGCPAAGTDCVDASGATISGDPIIVTANGGGKQINVCGGSFTEASGGFPKFNSGSSPTTYNVAQVLFSEYTIGGVAQLPRGTVPPQCGGPGTGASFNP